MPRRNPYLVALGERIARGRKAIRLTQAGLAERAGVNEKYLSDVECGAVNTSVLVIRAIAKGLGSTPARLLAAPEEIDSEVSALLADCSAPDRAKVLEVVRVLTAPPMQKK